MADNITALTQANRNTGAHIICCLCELWTTNLKQLSQYIATETIPLFQLPWFWKHFKTNFKHPKTWVKPKTVLYFNIPNTNMWKKNSTLTIPVVFMCWSILGSWTMTCCWWAEKRQTVYYEIFTGSYLISKNTCMFRSGLTVLCWRQEDLLWLGLCLHLLSLLGLLLLSLQNPLLLRMKTLHRLGQHQLILPQLRSNRRAARCRFE